MASELQNLSSQVIISDFDFTKSKIAIITADWNSEITDALKMGAIERLIKEGIHDKNIFLSQVPGTFELPLAAQWMAQKDKIDAIIVLGCVIQGDTPHFDYVCQGVTQGIMDVNLKYNKPVVFGVLTTLTLEQATDRAGGKHGNKGDEAAITALKMLIIK